MFAAHLYGNRFRYLVLLLVFTLGLLVSASQVGIDNSLKVWFPADDPAFVEYNYFQKTFGNDEVIAIAIRDEKGFLSEQGLLHLRRITETLEAIDGVSRVTSLSSFVEAWDEGYGGRYPRMSDHPAAKNRLISVDEKTTLLLVELTSFENVDIVRPKILAEIRHRLLSESAVHIAGIGVIYDALNQLAMEDSAKFIAAGYLLILLLLWYFTGRIVLVIAAVSAAGVSSVWLMGFYGAAGRDINMVTMVMPSILLVICISMCIHIFHQFKQLSPSLGNQHRIVQTLSIMVVPCTFNILTSAVGFLSLCLSDLKVVSDLGLFSAVGLLASLVVCLICCAVVLGRKNLDLEIVDRDSSSFSLSENLTNFALDKPYWVISVTALLFVVSIIGINRIVVDTNSLGFIVDEHVVVKDSRAIENEIGPYTPLEFIVSGEQVLSAPVIRAIQRWEKASVESGVVAWSHSVSTYIDRFPVAASIELLRDFPLVDGLYDSLVKEPNEVRVTFGVPIQSASEIEATLHKVKVLADFPEGVDIRQSGYVPLYVSMMSLIVDTLVQSLMIAFVVIFIMLFFLFCSFSIVLLAIPSNLLPVVLVLGVMGWMGINLDVATVTIAAIVLGLVVDDTVQFLYRYQYLRKSVEPIHAIKQTAKTIGHSMSATTIAMSAGLIVLTLANVKSVIWFGLLIPCAMIFALIADLLVIPALIAIFSKTKPLGAEK